MLIGDYILMWSKGPAIRPLHVALVLEQIHVITRNVVNQINQPRNQFVAKVFGTTRQIFEPAHLAWVARLRNNDETVGADAIRT